LSGFPHLLEEAKKEVIAGDPVSKLKWILSKTMGSPIAFESRRAELRLLGMPATDEDVFNSFLSILQPGTGLLWRFLSLGRISLLLGDNLFVHGALHDHNIGWLPPSYDYCSSIESDNTNNNITTETEGEGEIGTVVDDPLEWDEKINRFVVAEMDDYSRRSFDHLISATRETLGLANPNNPSNPKDDSNPNSCALQEFLWETKGGYDHKQPGSRLIQYGMGGLPGPQRRRNRTVVYSSYIERSTLKPLLTGRGVTEWLKKRKIKRIIVGHQVSYLLLSLLLSLSLLLFSFFSSLFSSFNIIVIIVIRFSLMEIVPGSSNQQWIPRESEGFRRSVRITLIPRTLFGH
jgi:hypothetical protein